MKQMLAEIKIWNYWPTQKRRGTIKCILFLNKVSQRFFSSLAYNCCVRTLDWLCDLSFCQVLHFWSIQNLTELHITQPIFDNFLPLCNISLSNLKPVLCCPQWSQCGGGGREVEEPPQLTPTGPTWHFSLTLATSWSLWGHSRVILGPL